MNLLNHLSLTRGIALVLAGPEGCGKTQLARTLAQREGSFREVPLAQLETPFGLAEALEEQPQTLIVDGFPKRPSTLELAKQLLAYEHTVAQRKNAWPLKVPSPKLIFCTSQVAAARDVLGTRRFHVVLLPARAPQH